MAGGRASKPLVVSGFALSGLFLWLAVRRVHNSAVADVLMSARLDLVVLAAVSVNDSDVRGHAQELWNGHIYVADDS